MPYTPLPHKKRNESIFLFALLGATFLMGTSFPSGKILLAKTDLFPLLGWRFVVAAIATLPLVFWDARRSGSDILDSLLPSSNQWPTIVLIGILQTGLVMGLGFYAMETLSPAIVAILLFTNPLWVGLASPFLLGEKLSLPAIVGLGIGIVGVGLTVGVEMTSADPVAYMFGVASGIAWAGATILQKRTPLTISPFVLAFWQMLIGGLSLLAIAVISGDPWIDELQGWDWGWFIWLAVPASTGSFGLWALALSKGGAARSSSFLFLAPLFSVLLSVLILETSMDAMQLVGGLLIGASIWAINLAPRKAILEGIS